MRKRNINPFSNIFGLVEEFNYKLNLYSLVDMFLDTMTVYHMEHVYNSVIDNCKFLDSCNDLLPYLEACYIKMKSPVINACLKLWLFK